ncbi:hypothetical protein [Mycobacteroides saopaulense]|nr:hypothetical protein [Mycobacteroides saopaulense]
MADVDVVVVGAGRTHWAGAEVAQQWSGYMERCHPVGQAADEILAEV